MKLASTSEQKLNMFEITSSDDDGTLFSGRKKPAHGRGIFPKVVCCTGLLRM